MKFVNISGKGRINGEFKIYLKHAKLRWKELNNEQR